MLFTVSGFFSFARATLIESLVSTVSRDAQKRRRESAGSIECVSRVLRAQSVLAAFCSHRDLKQKQSTTVMATSQNNETT